MTQNTSERKEGSLSGEPCGTSEETVRPNRVGVFSSLRFRLLLVVFAAFVPTWLTLIHEISVRRHNALQRILDDSLSAAELAAVREEQILEGTTQILRTMAQVFSRPSATCRDLARMAEGVMTPSERYANFGVASLSGRILCSVVKSSEPSAISKEFWFRQSLKGGRLSIFYYRAPILHKPVILVTTPIRTSTGPPRGLLYASIDISWLIRSSLPDRIARNPRALFALVDKSRVVATRRPGENPLARKLNSRLTEHGSVQEPIVQIVSDPDGVEWVCARAPIHSRSQNAALAALLAIPKEDAFKEVETTQKEGLLLIATVTLLALLIVWYIGGRVFWGPLTRLVEATGRIAAGDLTARSGMSQRKDELGLLARTFDAMAAALERRERQHLEAEEAIRRSEEQLRRLGIHLQQIREEEQKNLALEIHDDIGQILTALRFDLSWLRKRMTTADTDAIQERISRMFSLLDRGMESVHRICGQLRPRILDDLGLAEALRWQAEEFSKRTGIAVNIDGVDNVDVPQEHAVALFRIFQESLTNVARHAEASSVDVTLFQEDDAVTLVVDDDGRGIDPDALENPRSFGLMSMRERATALGGSFSIRKRESGGTTVTVRLPLSFHSNEENPFPSEGESTS